MISISLENGDLELYKDSNIVWSWTAFRFQDKLRDQYTNNFSIPKTMENIKSLGIYSLLDTPDIQFRGRIQPAMLYIGEQTIPIYIQVVSINEKDIDICIFEDKLTYTIKNKTLNEFFVDDSSSIYEWFRESNTLYPNEFKVYNYGAPYYTKSITLFPSKLNAQYAQVHPSKPLNDILQYVISELGANIVNINPELRLLASKRVVCPQNTTQVLEFNSIGSKLSNNLFTIYGGQHIVNDVSQTGIQQITFNRDVNAVIDLYSIWSTKFTFNQNSKIQLIVNGSVWNTFNIPSYTYDTGCKKATFRKSFKEGDTLSFKFEDANHYINTSWVAHMEYSNYEITEDDYGTNLEYTPRRASLSYWPNNQQSYNYWMDGSTISIGGLSMTTEPLALSYFGYYCNLPKISLGDVLYSLQWILGGKLKQDGDHIYFDGKFYNGEVEGQLDKLIFSSNTIGQKNYVKFNDEENPISIANIDNEWLEYEKNLHINTFRYLPQNVIPQYESTTNEEGETVYEFQDSDVPVLFRWINEKAFNPGLFLFDLNNISQSKEIQLTIFNAPMNILDLDTIYLDGRTYYIINGEKDLNTNIVKIKAILIYKKTTIR